jgi:hypothetical protein
MQVKFYLIAPTGPSSPSAQNFTVAMQNMLALDTQKMLQNSREYGNLLALDLAADVSGDETRPPSELRTEERNQTTRVQIAGDAPKQGVAGLGTSIGLFFRGLANAVLLAKDRIECPDNQTESFLLNTCTRRGKSPGLAQPGTNPSDMSCSKYDSAMMPLPPGNTFAERLAAVRETISAAAAAEGVPANILYGLMMVEGNATFVHAMSTGQAMSCKQTINALGTVGMWNILDPVCGSGTDISPLDAQPGTALCDYRTAAPIAARKLKANMSFLSQNRGNFAVNTKEGQYLLAASWAMGAQGASQNVLGPNCQDVASLQNLCLVDMNDDGKSEPVDYCTCVVDHFGAALQ